MKGVIGQVTGIDEEDPSGKLFIEFDDSEIYDWLPKSAPLPSAWMDLYETALPSYSKELQELASKEVTLFFQAADGGDLRTAKLLHCRHGVNADEARKPDGKTALHLASLKGHYDLVQWLLEKAKVNVNKPDNRGYSAIHYAVLGYSNLYFDFN